VSFAIPAGWKTEGGVKRFPDNSILASLLMTIAPLHPVANGHVVVHHVGLLPKGALDKLRPIMQTTISTRRLSQD